MSHIHTCMACGVAWHCPHPTGDCKAGEKVFPTLVLRGPNGPTVFLHACKRETRGEEYTIGKYTIRPGMETGRVWIETETGEGGDFDPAGLEKVIATFYKKNF